MTDSAIANTSALVAILGAFGLMLKALLADKARATRIIERHIRRSQIVELAVLHAVRGCPQRDENPASPNPTLDALIAKFESETLSEEED